MKQEKKNANTVISNAFNNFLIIIEKLLLFIVRIAIF